MRSHRRLLWWCLVLTIKSDDLLAVYLHIPFCVRKCRYCDFYSLSLCTESTPEDLIQKYVLALIREISFFGQQSAFQGKKIGSLYLGGGTPTLLTIKQLSMLAEELKKWFVLSESAEITIEANPGTVSEHYLCDLRDLGFNRLSLGCQSFINDELKLMGRIHSAGESSASFAAARAAGSDNINLDLIFGIPGQTTEQWIYNLQQVMYLKPEHLSLYNLQLEDGTELARLVHDGNLAAPDEDIDAEMYQTAIYYALKNGYVHYEISNFARPGKQSRHNLVYWHDQYYLGLGAGAHSYYNGCRWSDIRDIKRYCHSLRTVNDLKPEKQINDLFMLNDLLEECEELTPQIEMSEFMIMGLRLQEGISRKNFNERFKIDIHDMYGKQIDSLICAGLLYSSGDKICLTERGMMLANQVFVEFV